MNHALVRLVNFGQRNSLKLTSSLLAALVALGAAVVYMFDPRIPGLYPICPFFGVTGFHCPGCGTLRALHVLLHGDLSGALGYNLLTVMSLPFIAYSFTSKMGKDFLDRALPLIFIPHQLIWGLLVAVLAFWTLRNVPLAPFNVLAP